MLFSFLPDKSISTIRDWISELSIKVYIRNPRATKQGDFRVLNSKMQITINSDLNKYSFLITLTHEIAHAFVYRKHANTVKAHGLEWKGIFSKMLLKLVHLGCFPADIMEVLEVYIKNPRASTLTDVSLSSVLISYDYNQIITISEISEGDKFIFRGKEFIKGKRIVKRFKCIRADNREYLFHPLARISLV